MQIFNVPYRTYGVIALTLIGLILSFIAPSLSIFLWAAAALGSLDTFWESAISLVKRQITIDTFNVFALIVSFATGEVRSAAFIVLMLRVAQALDWHTQSRSRNATEELLKLKPLTALVEKGEAIKEIPVDEVKKDDIIIVKSGSRVPVDGIVVFGSAYFNEAPVSGESRLVEKVAGDPVLSGTLNDSGAVKFKATNVGKESTIEQMAALMRRAAQHKSRSEKIANKFARWFLPFVIGGGIATYLITKNASMTAAFFLIACADDIAVSIPLAMAAALGKAASRGVIVKGGEYLDVLGKIKTLVLDKTGTLTYGTPEVSKVHIDPSLLEKEFWLHLASAEKFSEHPISHAIMHEAAKHFKEIPDPTAFEVVKGSGVRATVNKKEVIIGNELMLQRMSVNLPPHLKAQLEKTKQEYGATTFLIFIDKRYAGMVAVADTPRKEAKQSLRDLKNLGISHIAIFTGDNEQTARHIAKTLDIEDVRSSMTPEKKLGDLELLTKEGITGMVGDGINDAPVLSRAHVGIAMGSGGTAVAVEAADVVVMTDDLSRIPEMVLLGRKTSSVIYGDMVIWVISNAIGFALVLTGIAGPAFAALYNFLTDFLPLMNSARLFKK